MCLVFEQGSQYRAAGLCTEVLVPMAPCSMPWWACAAALVVCSAAVLGTSGHVLRGGDKQDPRWWPEATQGSPSRGWPVGRDCSPQGQQSWEQGSCLHLGEEPCPGARSRGAARTWGQAGAQEDQ